MKRASPKRIRRIFGVLGLIGLALVLWENRSSLSNFVPLLTTLRWYVLVSVVIIQLGSYWLNGLYYRSILRIFAYDLKTSRLFEGALATNFVNYLLPSAGLAGAGYLSQVLAPEVPRGVSVLVQLMRYAFSALAVLLMMPVGFLLIYAESNKGGRSLLDVTVISALGITALAVGLVVLVQHEALLRRALHATLRFLQRFFKSLKEDKVTNFVDQFYVGYRAMTNNKRRMLQPFGWSILYIVVEILTFYMAFLAFGKTVNPGTAVMAYLFANIVSIFGGVIISTGVFELGMAGTLIALGVPFALAVAVTTVYRIMNLLIGLPPGYIFYRKFLPITKEMSAAPSQTKTEHPTRRPPQQ
ncbi:lysylphosphatidylglycerol synthase transmembrane domain-containing protein [Ferrimicrobium sp.]|uniref:lysylphosphatidylglycerol synthase transmembrane domain-containing protein n=1 Tax=Ferrimicrobium sp. TaxID=2926050 RepID=UPI00261832B8|nr:lysylphosphatidylglycerol synthase transmembrane domain-containing protein [Ferrimicrobium sp.]